MPITKPTDIVIDNQKDQILTSIAVDKLNDGYLLKNETPQQGFARACAAYGTDKEHAQRLYDYVSNQWFMFASPVLSNGGTSRGFPISCFLSDVDDSIKSIVDKWRENSYLSVLGGGIGNNFSKVRSVGTPIKKGGTTPGVIPFINNIGTQMASFQQGSCYDGETEVLTSEGWVNFKDVEKTMKFAQVDDSLKITYAEAKEVVKEKHVGDMISLKGPSTDLFVTPNHSMVLERLKTENGEKVWKNSVTKVRADLVKYHRDVRHHVAGEVHFSDNNAEKNLEDVNPVDLFKVAFQADGFFDTQGFINFRFTKARKIERLETLCTLCGFKYNKHLNKDGVVVFYFPSESGVYTHIFSKHFRNSLESLENFNFKQAREVISEVRFWDGHQSREHVNSFSYSTVNSDNIDYLQALCSVAKCRTKVKTYYNREGNRQDLHTLYIQMDYKAVQGDSLTKEVVKNYDGYVYCVEVPEGKLIVRRNGHVSVCGNTRRGSAAVYLDISHPEIQEFITKLRAPTDGDYNRKCLQIGFHHAVNIPDAFMEAVINGDDWDLIDPHTKETRSTVSARQLWKDIIYTRSKTGEPYIHFIDTSNRALPQVLKDKGLRINCSNLCNEIMLPTGKGDDGVDRTAVCCLSSINLEKFDEWKGNEQFIKDLLEMLDNVLEDFIQKAPDEIAAARNSAVKERSIGLGAMGFHSLLQSKNIPFESQEASDLNKTVFSWIKGVGDKFNLELGELRGSPEDLQGTGKRFAHMFAIAPNASSSIICSNVSPSIEPFNSNVFTQDTKTGTSIVRNKHLKKRLEELDKDTYEVWQSITVNQGSVQHLDFLSVRDKATFKTSFELDQEWIIQHAADRQPYICQGQSVNLFVPSNIPFSKMNTLHMKAWKLGLKGLYYCRSKVRKATHYTSQSSKNTGHSIECVGCEG